MSIQHVFKVCMVCLEHIEACLHDCDCVIATEEYLFYYYLTYTIIFLGTCDTYRGAVGRGSLKISLLGLCGNTLL